VEKNGEIMDALTFVLVVIVSLIAFWFVIKRLNKPTNNNINNIESHIKALEDSGYNVSISTKRVYGREIKK
jgi:preprotein translocase subunit YajC